MTKFENRCSNCGGKVWSCLPSRGPRITICPHTGGVFSRIGAIVACNRVSNSDARTEHEVLAPSHNPKPRGYCR